MKKILCLLLACAFIFCAVAPTFAADDVVNTGEEIQALIDAANSGDVLHIKVDANFYQVLGLKEAIKINKPIEIYFEFGSKTNFEYIEFCCKTDHAFYIDADNVTLHFGDKIAINGAMSNTIHGEAIYVQGNHCTIDGGFFSRCGVPERIKTFGNEYDGGAIYVDGTDCTIQNADFGDCTGYDGGAICVNQHNCHVIDCEFTDCNAMDDGGAIYVCYGTYGFVASGCSFTDCSCKDEDSGQFIEGARDAKVYNCNPNWGDKKYYAYCAFVTSNPLGSFISSGTLWIIVAVAVVAIACVVVIITKKNKKVAA